MIGGRGVLIIKVKVMNQVVNIRENKMQFQRLDIESLYHKNLNVRTDLRRFNNEEDKKSRESCSSDC